MRKNSKNTRKKFLKMFIIAVVSVIACILLFLLVTNLAARKSQLNSLNSASDDLYRLYAKILKDPSIVQGNGSYAKKCFQASAKFSEGTITCGGDGQATLGDNSSYDSQREDSINLIKRSTDFTYTAVENIHNDKTDSIEGFAIHFTHNKTGILCELTLESLQYQMSCLETVPDFLPGYTIEK